MHLVLKLRFRDLFCSQLAEFCKYIIFYIQFNVNLPIFLLFNILATLFERLGSQLGQLTFSKYFTTLNGATFSSTFSTIYRRVNIRHYLCIRHNFVGGLSKNTRNLQIYAHRLSLALSLWASTRYTSQHWRLAWLSGLSFVAGSRSVNISASLKKCQVLRIGWDSCADLT